MNLSQSFVMNGGFLSVALYCAWLVSDRCLARLATFPASVGPTYLTQQSTRRTLTVGDFVLMAAYYSQLMGPLNWLGTLYRVIQVQQGGLLGSLRVGADILSFRRVSSTWRTCSTSWLRRWRCRTAPWPQVCLCVLVCYSFFSGLVLDESPEIEFEGVSFAYDPEKPVLKVMIICSRGSFWYS